MKAKVLVIDRNPDFIGATRDALEDSYRVISTSTKKGVMERIRKEVPDFVILGYLEPRGTSFEVHKELREKSRTKNVPLLVVDASVEEHPRKGWRKEEGMQMDADDYITQPIEPARLREMVHGILQRSLARS